MHVESAWHSALVLSECIDFHGKKSGSQTNIPLAIYVPFFIKIGDYDFLWTGDLAMPLIVDVQHWVSETKHCARSGSTAWNVYADVYGFRKTITLYLLDSLIALYVRKKDGNNVVPT